MSDLRERRKRILAACSAGDHETLESLFQELAIHGNPPSNPYGVDRSVPEEERVITQYDMVLAAVKSERIDTVNLLYSKFPLNGFEVNLILYAIETGNTQLVEAMCKHDPNVANGDTDNYESVFQLACSKPENADIISVLLKSGADPNKRSSLLWSNAHFAVLGNMPVSTLQQCFDHGYCLHDGTSSLASAVERKRLDLVELFFTRGKHIPAARFGPMEELIELARKNNDLEMENLIKRLYPRKKGALFESLAKALHLKR